MNNAENTHPIHIPKIFVVCNRPDTAALWGYILREKGLSVALESALEKVIEHWSTEASDVMVIDVDSENQDLLEICKTFRAISIVPILLLLPAHHEILILDAYAAGIGYNIIVFLFVISRRNIWQWLISARWMDE